MGSRPGRIRRSPYSGRRHHQDTAAARVWHPVPIAAVVGSSTVVSEFTGYFEHSRVLLRIRPGQPVIPALTLPSPLSNIDALAASPSGAIGFADFGASQIGELQAGGSLRLFGDQAPHAGLSDITSGPDGAIWYTEQAGLVGRITPADDVTQLALSGAGSEPNGIAAGPARTIWVTETGIDTKVSSASP